eukprot:9708963-Karenia_brevis.AAC.1
MHVEGGLLVLGFFPLAPGSITALVCTANPCVSTAKLDIRSPCGTQGLAPARPRERGLPRILLLA